MSSHQYSLKKCRGVNQKLTCPSCGGKHKFVPYVDNDSKEILSELVGRCDREVNCGYHYKPAQHFDDNGQGRPSNSYEQKRIIEPVKPPSFIPGDLFRKSRTAYDQNNFVKFLLTVFDGLTVNRLIELYNIGTSKYIHRNPEYPDYTSLAGCCIFWQLDMMGNIRTGKIMLYDPLTGKRVKEPFDHVTWAHALRGADRNRLFPEFNLSQSYFGTHLLKLFPEKPIALVESEKTAVICSAYYPKYNWLACGSLTHINAQKCAPFANKKVVFFPDLNGFDKWAAKANELSYIASITVSDVLENIATDEERANGLDLADYVLRFPIDQFLLRNQLRSELINNDYSPEEQEQLARTFLIKGLQKEYLHQLVNELVNDCGFELA